MLFMQNAQCEIMSASNDVNETPKISEFGRERSWNVVDASPWNLNDGDGTYYDHGKDSLEGR